MRINHDKMIF